MENNLDQQRQLLGELTARERDVLKLMARGCNNAQIAERLFISPHTVKNHVSNIYRKMGIDDRTQVALLALRLGLVPLERGE